MAEAEAEAELEAEGVRLSETVGDKLFVGVSEIVTVGVAHEQSPPIYLYLIPLWQYISPPCGLEGYEACVVYSRSSRALLCDEPFILAA